MPKLAPALFECLARSPAMRLALQRAASERRSTQQLALRQADCSLRQRSTSMSATMTVAICAELGTGHRFIQAQAVPSKPRVGCGDHGALDLLRADGVPPSPSGWAVSEWVDTAAFPDPIDPLRWILWTTGVEFRMGRAQAGRGTLGRNRWSRREADCPKGQLPCRDACVSIAAQYRLAARRHQPKVLVPPI